MTEGVETFEDIWQKVHNATNSNQKEKYEADLKKEIKKLQRLRDQIKSWIASAEIKDKTVLMDNRRLIETQMERFKVVERETKTKAYSKEGLGAAQKLDPAQREKEEISTWLQSSISQLQIQTDTYESEIESLLANKKKKIAKETQDKLDDLKYKLERHKFHITKLETLLRMLDNDGVDVDQIKKIKDDVEYYIESSQEPDFEENEYLYDDITGLDEMELDVVGGGITSVGTTETNSNGDEGASPTSMTSTTSPIQSPALNSSSAVNSNSTTSSVTAPTIANLNTINNNSNSNNNVNHVNVSSDSVSADYSDTKKNKPDSKVVIPVVKPTAVRANANNATSTSITTTTMSTINKMEQAILNSSSQANNKLILNSTPNSKSIVVSSSSIVTAPIAFSMVAKANLAALENGPLASMLAATTLPASQTPMITSGGEPATHQNSTQQQMQQQENHLTSNSSNCESPMTSPTPPPMPQQQQQPKQILQNGPTNNLKADLLAALTKGQDLKMEQSQPQPADTRPSFLMPDQNQTTTVTTPTSTNSQQSSVVQQNGLNMAQLSLLSATSVKSSGTNEAIIPPLLGVAPLGPSPLQKEHQVQFQMMESAFYHLPAPSDAERLRPYLHRQPITTPLHYPQTQLPHADTIEFFQRLSTESLFFIFYYMEGTKAQYLAAKALKKQSWRFHTKYMMWFQRHEEPKIINEDFEQGTYIYFDYEKWGQRKKEGFTFEYKYLEDKELN